jgi:hypothetical protein
MIRHTICDLTAPVRVHAARRHGSLRPPAEPGVHRQVGVRAFSMMRFPYADHHFPSAGSRSLGVKATGRREVAAQI